MLRPWPIRWECETNMTDTCIMTGSRKDLESARKRIARVISHTSSLIVDAGGLWLTTDCIAHDMSAIRRQVTA